MKKLLFILIMLITHRALLAETNFRSELSDAIRSYNIETCKEILSKYKDKFTLNDKVKYLNLAKERTIFIRNLLNCYTFLDHGIRDGISQSKKYRSGCLFAFVISGILLSISAKYTKALGVGGLAIGALFYIQAIRLTIQEGTVKSQEIKNTWKAINIAYEDSVKIQELVYDIANLSYEN